MISTTISSLLLLSTGVFSTPVYISDVKASREAGHLRVDVSGDGGIDPEGASTLIDDGRLVISLGGTKVRADNRSWSLRDGTGEIRAHRHRSQTELVVPLAGNGCSGPVELTGTDTGITALVGCDDNVAGAKGETVRPVAKMQKKTAVDVAKLKQIVELPATPPSAAESPAPKAPPALKAAPIAPAPNAVAHVMPPQAPAAPLNRVEAAKPVPKPAAPAAVVPARAPIAVAAPVGPIPAAEGSTPGSLRAIAVPAVLLAALAAVAYWLSRRRRGTVQRHIQILETTSLGPKRALICARIGEETVILSSSEAGITLLKGGLTSSAPAAIEAVVASNSIAAAVRAAAGVVTHQPVAAWAATPDLEAAAAAIEIEQPLQEALADIPEPTGPVALPVRASFRAIEGGLAGLFGKREGGLGRDESADRFEDLLEDSLEDQELRQKLAAGLSARVR